MVDGGVGRLTITFWWWVEATLLGQGHGEPRVDAEVGKDMLVVAEAVQIGDLDDCATLFSRRGWGWTLNCREALSQLG